MHHPQGGAAPSVAAVASLVVGVLGVVPAPVVALALRVATRRYVPPLPPFLLPACALLLARRALRDITQSSGTVGGRRLARAGQVLGLVGLVDSALFAAAWVVAFSKA